MRVMDAGSAIDDCNARPGTTPAGPGSPQHSRAAVRRTPVRKRDCSGRPECLPGVAPAGGLGRCPSLCAAALSIRGTIWVPAAYGAGPNLTVVYVAAPAAPPPAAGPGLSEAARPVIIEYSRDQSAAAAAGAPVRRGNPIVNGLTTLARSDQRQPGDDRASADLAWFSTENADLQAKTALSVLVLSPSKRITSYWGTSFAVQTGKRWSACANIGSRSFCASATCTADPGRTS